MADIRAESDVRVEDLVPVRSRISWGAIFAGAMVALASFLILTLLGGAIGLSVTGNVDPNAIGIGAALWAILTAGAALLLGGIVTTQCAVGENRIEAAIHGLIMWGTVLAITVGLAAAGVRSGFNAMLYLSYAGVTTEGWEAAAQRAGVDPATIAEWRRTTRGEPASDQPPPAPPTEQEVVRTATAATWWTLLGTVLSLAAAIGGALLGSGPAFQLVTVPRRARMIVMERHEYAGRTDGAAVAGRR